MIRPILIKNLLLRSISNPKKLKFYTEFGIFLVIAALISSGISIYYETKLSNYKNELIKLELKEFKIQEWLTDAPITNLQFKTGKFNYDLIEGNSNFNLGKNTYYFHLLTIYPDTINLAITNIEAINNQSLNKKYKIEKIKTENKVIDDFMGEIYEKYPDELVSDSEYRKKVDILLNNISFKKINNMLDQSKYNTLQIYLYFQDYNNIVDDEKERLKKLIVDTTKTSTNAILYAFLLQLIVFSLVQIFELREL
jgi:ribosomal protein S17E